MSTAIQFYSHEQLVHGNFFSAVGTADLYPTLLLLSGFPGNEADVLGLGELLSNRGFNACMFNYRGTYRSAGLFSLANTMEDIAAAFAFLRETENVARFRIDTDRLTLGGWSYGGGMALIYAANHPDVTRVFSISGTDHGEFAREYQRNSAFAKLIESDFETLMHPVGPVRPETTRGVEEELIPNVDRYDLLSKTIQLVDRDLLLIGGWNDHDVLIEDHVIPCYRRLKQLGSEKVSIQAFADSHQFENCRLVLAAAIADWVSGAS